MSNKIKKEFNKEEILKMYAEVSKNTLMETLEIEYIDAGPDFLVAKMPVNPRVHQPMGLLHGGASVALAESLGSGASLMLIDPKTQEIRGIEISANHVKSKRAGHVFGTARLLHRGRTVHLWEIRITDENDVLVSICKITNIVIDKTK
ncbi:MULTISPECIES: PaaI family thioesterase [Myroides]|uniref:PaaI family thioesterase n=1 Tax=Myroides TaxID=76831 RepID=UPI001303BA0E|nr:PaaI family thioesterase [Myroides phaeus]